MTDFNSIMKKEFEIDANPDEIDSIAKYLKNGMPSAADGSVWIVEGKFIRVITHNDIDATWVTTKCKDRFRVSSR